jgi:hypothetical protein
MLAHKQAEHPSRSVPAGQRAAASGRAFRATNPDIVDACVAAGALCRRDLVISSDPDDLHAISRHLEIDHP